MSTRSTTHFHYGPGDVPTAIVYRHPDGYPTGAGADLYDFIDRCAKLRDSRFNDPSYLAAKYVVFLAEMFAHTYNPKTGGYDQNADRLEFISVGVLNQDPGDIDYRYHVICDGSGRHGAPRIECEERDYANGGWRAINLDEALKAAGAR